MFETAMLSTLSRQTGRRFALPLSIGLHAAAVLALLGASLWRSEEPPDPAVPIVCRLVTGAPPPPLGNAHAPAAGRASGRRPPTLPALQTARSVSVGTAPATDAVRDALGPDQDVASNLADPDSVPGGAGKSGPRGAGEEVAGDEPRALGPDVRAPLLLHRVEPDYPEAARKIGVEGVVILQAVIGTSGQVEELRVVRSASALLDASAARAVRQWRYGAATVNGRAVRVYLEVTVAFRLR